MKKKLKKATTALMVMVLCIAMPLTAFAVSESEDNNTVATADTINVNEWVYGTVLNRNDIDYYKVTIPSNGYVQINLKHEYGKGSVWAYLNTYDGSTEKEYMCMHLPSDSEETTSEKIGIEKGTYYVKIEQSSNYSLEYNFQVNFTSTDSWETEPNGNVSKADSISVNSRFYGTVLNRNDIDYYKVTIPSNGYVQINLKHEYGKGSVWAYLNTYDGSTEKEYMCMHLPSDSEETTSEKIGIEKGTYYVKIEQSSNYSLEYNFQVNFTSTNSWETEFNDNVSKADDFSLGSKKNGVISDNSDKDYYKISVLSSGKYNVALEHAYKDSGSFNVAVCSYDGTSETKISDFKSSGNSQKDSMTVDLQSGTYYICVSGSGGVTDLDYAVSMSKGSGYSSGGGSSSGGSSSGGGQSGSGRPGGSSSGGNVPDSNTYVPADAPVDADSGSISVYNYFEYTVYNYEIIICRYTGTDTDVSIPSEIDGMPVTGIAENAFAGSCAQRIEVPSSVYQFGTNAFGTENGENRIIVGEKDSPAERYAADNGMVFEYSYDNDNIKLDIKTIIIIAIAASAVLAIIVVIVVYSVRKKKIEMQVR